MVHAFLRSLYICVSSVVYTACNYVFLHFSILFCISVLTSTPPASVPLLPLPPPHSGTRPVDPEPNRFLEIMRGPGTFPPELPLSRAAVLFAPLITAFAGAQTMDLGPGGPRVALWGITVGGGGGAAERDIHSTMEHLGSRPSEYHTLWVDARNVMLEFASALRGRKVMAQMMREGRREGSGSGTAGGIGRLRWDGLQWWPVGINWAKCQLSMMSSSGGVGGGSGGRDGGAGNQRSRVVPPRALTRWSCSACTLVNEPRAMACITCGNPRPGDSWEEVSVPKRRPMDGDGGGGGGGGGEPVLDGDAWYDEDELEAKRVKVLSEKERKERAEAAKKGTKDSGKFGQWSNLDEDEDEVDSSEGWEAQCSDTTDSESGSGSGGGGDE